MNETEKENVVSETPEGEKNESDKQKEKKSFPGVNLYVKNLDDSFTDAKLREVFSKFGAIISTKMMFQGSHPKGFGFVCFSSQEEAQLAVSQMNGRIVGSKPLYVTYAQKKEDRKAFLEKKYKEMSSGAIAPNGPPPPPVSVAAAAPVAAPVKSPTLMPPTSPPATAYYPAPTAQNIHYQYFPAGHIAPWGNMMPVQVSPQYFPTQSQPVLQQQTAQFENGVTPGMPTMMWTTNNYTLPQQAVPRPAGAILNNNNRAAPPHQNFHQQKSLEQTQPSQQAYYIQ